MALPPEALAAEEIRRAELKRLVAAALGGTAAVMLPPRGHGPLRAPQDHTPLPPRMSHAPPLLLDTEWCMVTNGTYMSLVQFRERLREGRMAFAWMGTQIGPGVFQPGPYLTLGQAIAAPDGKLRAASSECVFDRSPLTFDPSLDRWKCDDCGSAFRGDDGRVLSPPAQKPLLTFSEVELDGGRRFALVPPNSKPPR